MIGYIIRLNPFRLLSRKEIFISQVLHRFHSISHIGRKNSLSMIESMIASVVDLPCFDAANLFTLCVDSMVEGLAHDPFACALQTVLASLSASH